MMAFREKKFALKMILGRRYGEAACHHHVNLALGAFRFLLPHCDGGRLTATSYQAIRRYSDTVDEAFFFRSRTVLGENNDFSWQRGCHPRSRDGRPTVA